MRGGKGKGVEAQGIKVKGKGRREGCPGMKKIWSS